MYPYKYLTGSREYHIGNLKYQKCCRDCIAYARGVGWPLRAPARYDFYLDLSPRRGVAGHWRAYYPGNHASNHALMPARARARMQFVMFVTLEVVCRCQKARHISQQLAAEFPSNNKAHRAINTAGHKKEPPPQRTGAKSRGGSRLLAPAAGYLVSRLW